MKQTIREKCFETNSSSYHTLTIQKIKGDIPRKEIEKGKNLIINTRINFKTIGYTESYSYTARSTYEKAQLLLRFIASRVDEQLMNIVDKTLYTDIQGHWIHEKRDAEFKNRFYDIPLIQAYVKAIKKFIGEENQVIIEYIYDSSPFMDEVCDYDRDLYHILDISEEQLTDVDILTDRFYDIIFNPEIEIIEECESNE